MANVPYFVVVHDGKESEPMSTAVLVDLYNFGDGKDEQELDIYVRGIEEGEYIAIPCWDDATLTNWTIMLRRAS